ncbi:MAG: hypothetical protein KatS3mg030_730 [Saprospiraceae bacterium]|nr:MAG: hypothetical protein KatS3mg030_730 [Saprospiraceae bacterium]
MEEGGKRDVIIGVQAELTTETFRGIGLAFVLEGSWHGAHVRIEDGLVCSKPLARGRFFLEHGVEEGLEQLLHFAVIVAALTG